MSPEDECRAQKIEIAKLRVKVNTSKEELEKCIRSLDLDRAQELKLQLSELEEQIETLQVR